MYSYTVVYRVMGLLTFTLPVLTWMLFVWATSPSCINLVQEVKNHTVGNKERWVWDVGGSKRSNSSTEWMEENSNTSCWTGNLNSVMLQLSVPIGEANNF